MCFARSLLLTHKQQMSRPPIVALLVGEELMVWDNAVDGRKDECPFALASLLRFIK